MKKIIFTISIIFITVINTVMLAQKTAPIGTKITWSMFRQLNISKGAVIKLNDKIVNYKALVIPSKKKNEYNLKPGSYGVADSIWLETTGAGLIKSFNFYYDYDTAYVHEKRKYQVLFENEGIERTLKEPGTNLTVCTWSNSDTMFELIEITGRDGKTRVYSVVYNLALKRKKSYLLEKYIQSYEI